jgi:glutamyl-tRNA synthetase
VLRVEDTDQSRFVEGAEDYIVRCLEWCGIEPDESPQKGGPYGPYRQSERKHFYYQFAQQLIDAGYAYYAFDTPEELDQMRQAYKNDANPTPQYDHIMRMNMRNSLTMSTEEVLDLLAKGEQHVIRIKMPANTVVKFNDLIRGEVSFDAGLVDDKVLMKADGMPTYHLAVVVDDYLMKITHAFRGEEWLSSSPVHVLLWKYLGWEERMPLWAHLPLILKPDGHGKLSKRDGDRLGFPVFAMDWHDPRSGDTTVGFRERGFLPEAFVNILAVLGWNDGSEQEQFSMEELIEKFSIERVHRGGAKFDYEKAKWFNQQYIVKKENRELVPLVKPFIEQHNIVVAEKQLEVIIGLIKERCHLLADFWEQGHFFFKTPETYNTAAIADKWNQEKKNFFQTWADNLSTVPAWNHSNIEEHFNEHLATSGLKKGDVLLPLRIMLVGDKYGPGVFQIAEVIEREATEFRISHTLSLL